MNKFILPFTYIFDNNMPKREDLNQDKIKLENIKDIIEFPYLYEDNINISDSKLL